MRQLYRRFGSRDNLLRELEQEISPDTRQRVLEAAFELLGESGLADLSMDDLPVRAGVSRATLYRLFAGKPALFRALIERYSPWEPIARVVEELGPDSPRPEHVIPLVAKALSQALSDRSAVLLRMVFEMSRADPDTTEGVRLSMRHGLPDLIRYVDEQMQAGTLRRMQPVLAIQLLVGPIVTHELTRPLAALIGYLPSREHFATQVAEFWLRSMTPEEDSRDRLYSRG